MKNLSNLENHKNYKFLANYYLAKAIVDDLQSLGKIHLQVIIDKFQPKPTDILDSFFEIKLQNTETNTIYPLIHIVDDEVFKQTTICVTQLFQLAEDINKKEYDIILNNNNILNQELLINIFNVFSNDPKFSKKFLELELQNNLQKTTKTPTLKKI